MSVDLTADIMARLNLAPKAKQPAKPSGAKPVSAKIPPPPRGSGETQTRIIEQYYADTRERELEISFGRFGFKDRFYPGVTAQQFEVLYKYLLEQSGSMYSTPVTTKDVVTIHLKYDSKTQKNNPTGVRTIRDERGAVTHEQKTRLSYYDNKDLNYRLSLRQEKSHDSVDSTSYITRARTRYTFQHKSGAFRIDMTKVSETSHLSLPLTTETQAPRGWEKATKLTLGTTDSKPNIKFEVEIELTGTPKITFDDISTYIQILTRIYQSAKSDDYILTSSAINDAITAHNRLFLGVKAHGGRLYKKYLSKPTNLRLDDLLTNKYTITRKLDGLRRLIFITSTATFALSLPDDVWKIGPGSKGYNDTLIDTEYYDGKYYVFDLLFFRGTDVRSEMFTDRFDKLRSMMGDFEKVVTAASVTKKEYYTGDVYQGAEDALAENAKSAMRTDGLIYQSLGTYDDQKTRKWKDVVQMTIDFQLATHTDIEYLPMVVDDIGNHRLKEFSPTDQRITVLVESGKIADQDPDGMIVECFYDPVKKVFLPQRWRMDRDKPNSLSTAIDVWKDITRPIPQSSITGKDFSILRRYHNLFKAALLTKIVKPKTRLMDIGSGRGGDISKWKTIGVSQVFAVEPNAENSAEMKRRLRSTDFEKSVVVINAGVEDTDVLMKKIETPVNCIAAFFSLTFLAQSEKKFNEMIATIQSALVPGGHFIGIVLDGTRVATELQEHPDGVKGPHDTFVITGKVNPKKTFGNEITTTINDESSMVHQVNEYLFPFNELEKRLTENGAFKLKQNGLLDSTEKILGYFDALPAGGKMFSDLNRFFVFKKKFVPGTKPVVAPEVSLGEVKLMQEPMTVTDGSTYVESVLWLMMSKYRSAKPKERQAMVDTTRQNMASRLTRVKFTTLNGGDIKQRWTNDKTIKGSAFEAYKLLIKTKQDIHDGLRDLLEEAFFEQALKMPERPTVGIITVTGKNLVPIAGEYERNHISDIANSNKYKYVIIIKMVDIGKYVPVYTADGTYKFPINHPVVQKIFQG